MTYYTLSSKILISCLNILHVTDESNRSESSNATRSRIHENKIFENLEDGIDNCDVVIMLRLQKERMHEALISEVDYYNTDGLTNKNLKPKKDVIVMHPGPINRGIEIDSEVADGEHSVILDQVSSGISVRMAIMSIIIDNRKNENNIKYILNKIEDNIKKHSSKEKNIKLIIVTKSQIIDDIKILINLGYKSFGENYLNEAKAKFDIK